MDTVDHQSRSPRATKRARGEDFNSYGLNNPFDPDSYLKIPDDSSIKMDLERASTPVRTGTAESPIQLSSPTRSSTGSLSELGTATPSLGPGSPTTAFSVLDGIPAPPKKRQKLTFAEREHQKIVKEIRDRERAEERARKEAEKREREQEKARKDAEKESDRKQKEQEKARRDNEKEIERAKKEAEKEIERAKKEAEKEQKRLIKEAEEAEKEKKRQAKEDEKRKKERAQPTLFAFMKTPAVPKDGNFGRNSMSPAPGLIVESSLPNTPNTKSSNTKAPQTEYEKLFPDFYVHEGVKVAPTTRFERDERATEILTGSIDDYLCGRITLPSTANFEPTGLFHTRGIDLKLRGKRVMLVEDIMNNILGLGGASQPIDLTRDSQSTQVKNTRSSLKSVPYKVLCFAEDVRPPYKGTYTKEPQSGMRALARNPFRKVLPSERYEEDSEAEWEEPEEGEDIDSEGEEEEDVDGDDDIDGFLDDENDDSANARRLAVQGDLEPSSTGLCWENHKMAPSNIKLLNYRMQVLSGIHSKFSFHVFNSSLLIL
jgi:chromatin assembly factor 1 subunit A